MHDDPFSATINHGHGGAFSAALLTDLYQLTMAQGYWSHGRANHDSIFHLFFRKHPFGGGFTVASGLDTALQLLDDFHFAKQDLAFLQQLIGHDEQPLFEETFLHYLEDLRLTVNIDAIPEGTIVFPHQPLMRVEGPMLECQILETLLLNVINFQTLIATKAARICRAAEGDTVLEFGTRRAQGTDGALSASRAAYVGGVHATSNVLAARLFGIPVKGTHAHSWVMSFASETEAFEAYAESMPNNCVFLVDTYDTLEGVERAIAVGNSLRQKGYELLGIRLDSGDLAYLSIEARKRLDEAGFQNTQIVASNDLDEHLITSLKRQGARISVWGVGTKLSTAYDQPALGGVYKLGAIRNGKGNWEPKIKLSEQLIKTSTPGKLQVYRQWSADRNQAIADLIVNELEPRGKSVQMVDPLDPTRRRSLNLTEAEPLLVPVMRTGRRVDKSPNLDEIRGRTMEQLTLFHDGHLRFENPHQYPVGLELSLYELKSRLALEMRGD